MARQYIIAMDSFKGCLTTQQAENAVKQELIEQGVNEGDIFLIPLSDGGEGFCSIVTNLLHGSMRSAPCHDPLMRPITAQYGIAEFGGRKVAIVESASACGYTLVAPEERNALNLTSYGLGEILKASVESGAEEIYLGLGGTSTCDGGVGMMEALYGVPDLPVTCLVDTAAPFCGEGGAVRMYGPQKGIPRSKMDDAEAYMVSLAACYKDVTDVDVSGIPGCGAAGGISGALKAFFNSEIVSGAEKVLELAGYSHLLESLEGEEVTVITGEGSFDAQTATGKLPWVVVEIAKKCSHGCEAICIAGKVAQLQSDCSIFDRIIQATPAEMFDASGMPLPEAMNPEAAAANIRKAVSSLI